MTYVQWKTQQNISQSEAPNSLTFRCVIKTRVETLSNAKHSQPPLANTIGKETFRFKLAEKNVQTAKNWVLRYNKHY